MSPSWLLRPPAQWRRTNKSQIRPVPGRLTDPSRRQREARRTSRTDSWPVAKAAWQNRPVTGCATPLIPERCSARTRSTPRCRDGRLRPGRAVGRGLRRTAARDLAGDQRLWREDQLPDLHDQALNPLRHQRSGVRHRKDLWEIRFDPYDVSRVWVRDHWRGGWITLLWRQLHRVAAPFGELAWDHTRRALPDATEEELADAVADLLERAHHGPAGGDGLAGLSRRDRRVAARTKASPPARIQPRPAPAGGEQDQDSDSRQENIAAVIPMPFFDPFAEADKRW